MLKTESGASFSSWQGLRWWPSIRPGLKRSPIRKQSVIMMWYMTKCYPHRVISPLCRFIYRWTTEVKQRCWLTCALQALSKKIFWFTIIKSWPIPISFYDATDVGIIFEMYFCPVKILNCTIVFFFYMKILLNVKCMIKNIFWNTYVCTCIYILMNASARSVFLPFFYTPYWIDATCAYTETNGIKTPVWLFLFYNMVVNIPKVMAYQQKKSAQFFLLLWYKNLCICNVQ